MIDKPKLLRSLGYRFLGEGMMVKPFGFNVIRYRLDTDEIESNFFGKGSVEGLLCWERVKISSDHKEAFLEKITCFEAWSTSSSIGRYVDFSFTTKEEYCNDIL